MRARPLTQAAWKVTGAHRETGQSYLASHQDSGSGAATRPGGQACARESARLGRESERERGGPLTQWRVFKGKEKQSVLIHVADNFRLQNWDKSSESKICFPRPSHPLSRAVPSPAEKEIRLAMSMTVLFPLMFHKTAEAHEPEEESLLFTSWEESLLSSLRTVLVASLLWRKKRGRKKKERLRTS